MCACVCVCVRGCVCSKIFEIFEACHVESADYTVCLCVTVSVSVSVSVLLWLPIWFSCVSTQSYEVVKGTSKSSTAEMHTLMQTTDIPVTKVPNSIGARCGRLIQSPLWKRISLKRTRIVVSTGGSPVPRGPLGLCWHQVSFSASILTLIKSLPMKHSPRWWWDGEIIQVSHELRLYGIHA